jgi:hypothetical protein
MYGHPKSLLSRSIGRIKKKLNLKKQFELGKKNLIKKNYLILLLNIIQ